MNHNIGKMDTPEENGVKKEKALTARILSSAVIMKSTLITYLFNKMLIIGSIFYDERIIKGPANQSSNYSYQSNDFKCIASKYYS